MELPKKIKDEIWDYCRANSISNIDEFTLKLVSQGFTIEKFGATPETKTLEKIVEIEKIVEVEKIVEKIVEVSVEKIVEKEVYVTDDSHTKEIAILLSEANTTIHKMTNDHGAEVNSLNRDLHEVKLELESVKKELVNEKNKNKRDIYGES